MMASLLAGATSPSPMSSSNLPIYVFQVLRDVLAGSMNSWGSVEPLAKTQVFVNDIDEMRRDKIHPVECRGKFLPVIEYSRCGFQVMHHEAVEIFFNYMTGMEERLTIAGVLGHKVFVKVTNECAVLWVDPANNELESHTMLICRNGAVESLREASQSRVIEVASMRHLASVTVAMTTPTDDGVIMKEDAVFYPVCLQEPSTTSQNLVWSVSVLWHPSNIPTHRVTARIV